MNIQYKTCTKCGEKKPLSEFVKSVSKKSGFTSCCKICMSKKSINWYNKNKENRRKQIKDYRDQNKEKFQQYALDYQETNKDKISKYQKEWYLKNKEKHLNQSKINYLKNKDKIIIKQKINRYNNVIIRISKNLRRKVLAAIKENWKSGHTIELLGCSVEFLNNHLESQFKTGMSWDNYGRGWGNKGMSEWHIDHIKPCASFDLSKPEEQQKCFNYTNLQPLWAKENLSKNKY